MSIIHSPHCSCCNPADIISASEKELDISITENSRRDFLKKAGRLGLGIGIGGGLITSPIAASGLEHEDAAYASKAMQQNKAVKTGKASLITLLHTADIHSQLLVHDELFIENNRTVYKKRGGFSTLKSMINTLRKEHPSHTLVIDGGRSIVE